MINNIDYELFVFGANVPRNEITVCESIVENDKGKKDAQGVIKYKISHIVKMYIAKFIMEKCIVTVSQSGEVISLRPLEK